MVAPDGPCVFANASFENVLGLSRRSVLRGSACWTHSSMPSVFGTPSGPPLATSYPPAAWRRVARPALADDPLPVRLIVNQMDGQPHVLVELVEIEQQEPAGGSTPTTRPNADKE